MCFKGCCRLFERFSRCCGGGTMDLSSEERLETVEMVGLTMETNKGSSESDRIDRNGIWGPLPRRSIQHPNEVIKHAEQVIKHAEQVRKNEVGHFEGKPEAPPEKKELSTPVLEEPDEGVEVKFNEYINYKYP